MPRPLKTRLNVRRARSRLLSQWKSSVNGAPVSAIVVGGGHLLTATTEYFPARLNAVADLAHELGVGVHVHSVGVSPPDTWETAAGAELRRFIGDESVSSISVRDDQSADYLAAAGLQKGDVRLALDPGLLAAKTFEIGKRLPGQRLRIGLGIMSPAVVRSIRTARSGIEDDFWIAVAKQLAATDVDVSLFTTGEAGDIRVAHRIAAQLNELGVAYDHQDIVPNDDADLVSSIAGYDAIVAQRLHASIISYALGVPSVGLGWEPKVRSFYQLIERLDYFVDDRDARPDDVSARALQTARCGLDELLRDRHIEACRDGIRSLASLIAKGD
ncbi:MAG: polysaccharide pyruvyl transferase family protein [Proteobacteria bacterium]|nr:polysaccharide pyruvyl transferase family protein [Pseudomonadota bacterium]